MNADGTGKALIDDSHYNEAGPVWPPDGTRIAFERAESGIWVINADGTGAAHLRIGRKPAWEPTP